VTLYLILTKPLAATPFVLAFAFAVGAVEVRDEFFLLIWLLMLCLNMAKIC
jgi:hypothetical protein